MAIARCWDCSSQGAATISSISSPILGEPARIGAILASIRAAWVPKGLRFSGPTIDSISTKDSDVSRPKMLMIIALLYTNDLRGTSGILVSCQKRGVDRNGNGR